MIHYDRHRITAKSRQEHDYKDRDDPAEAFLGGNYALDRLLYNTAYEKYSPDRVGWMSFLALLRVRIEPLESQALDVAVKGNLIFRTEMAKHPSRDSRALWPNTTSWPKIKYIQHSWDFMPPDASKPLASSTVGDIAVLVRRCGLTWTEFKPDEGIMMAEGGSHIITSMNLRMGMILRYRCLDGSLRKDIKRTLKPKYSGRNRDGITQTLMKLRTGQIPFWRKDNQVELNRLEKGRKDSEARNEDEASDNAAKSTDYQNWSTRFTTSRNDDKRMFGLVRSDPALNIPDFPHATKEECWETLAELSGDPDMRKHLSQESWIERYEFNDLLLMAPECLRQRGMPRFHFVTTKYFASVFFFTEWAFTELLTRYLNGGTLSDKIKTRSDGGTDQMKHVLRVIQRLANMDFDCIRDLEELHDYHEQTTDYFREKSKSGLAFHALLKAHFRKAPRFACRALAECNPGETKAPEYGSLPVSSGHNWRNRNMELYFLNLPDCIEVMRENGCKDEELVIEAWLTLMLRAFLLMKLCDFSSDLKGGYLPSRYYGSRIPIWLE